MAFFAKRLDVGLNFFFAEEPKLNFAFVALLLPSILGDGCVFSVTYDEMSTLGTPSIFWTRHMDCVTCSNGLVSREDSSGFALEGSVASSVALFPLRATDLSRFVLKDSVASSVALSPLRLAICLVASKSWLRLWMSFSFLPLPRLQTALMHVTIAFMSLFGASPLDW